MTTAALLLFWGTARGTKSLQYRFTTTTYEHHHAHSTHAPYGRFPPAIPPQPRAPYRSLSLRSFLALLGRGNPPAKVRCPLGARCWCVGCFQCCAPFSTLRARVSAPVVFGALVLSVVLMLSVAGGAASVTAYGGCGEPCLFCMLCRGWFRVLF